MFFLGGGEGFKQSKPDVCHCFKYVFYVFLGICFKPCHSMINKVFWIINMMDTNKSKKNNLITLMKCNYSRLTCITCVTCLLFLIPGFIRPVLNIEILGWKKSTYSTLTFTLLWTSNGVWNKESNESRNEPSAGHWCLTFLVSLKEKSSNIGKKRPKKILVLILGKC